MESVALFICMVFSVPVIKMDALIKSSFVGVFKYFTKNKTGNCGVQLWARLGSCKGEISGT